VVTEHRGIARGHTPPLGRGGAPAGWAGVRPLEPGAEACRAHSPFKFGSKFEPARAEIEVPILES
jgi:hypothetical protein